MPNGTFLCKKRIFIIGIEIIFLLTVVMASARAQQPSLRQLNCFIGPVTRSYGAGQWLVYSCDDGSSLVAVPAKGNQVGRFLFFIQKGKDGLYKVRGEGTGSKAASDAAGNELAALGPAGFAALLKATQNVTPLIPKTSM